MSERDESTGQFSSAEPVYGQASVERDQGYVPLVDEEPKQDSDELTPREAAALMSTDESEIRTYSAVAELDPNVSMTIDQAAKIMTDSRAADDAEISDKDDDALRAEVDKLRGVEEAKPDAKPEAAPELTPERIAEHPAFKETVEKLTSETEQERQNYRTNLEAATKIAASTFVSQFPEFANVEAEQYGALMQQIQQHNPARAAQIQATATKMGQLFQQHDAESKRATAESQTKLQTMIKTESDRFEKMISGAPKAERAEIEQGIVAKIKEYGGDVEQFLNLMTKSEFSNATVQRLLWDVGKLHRIETATRAVAAKPVPRVQRPGVARAPSERRGADLASLDNRLSQTGNIKDAVALLQAQRERANRG